MKQGFKKVFQFLYGPIIALVVFFMSSYKANRERLDDILKRKNVSSFLQGLAVIFLIIWIVIFSFAPDEKRDELTQEIKQSFEKFNSTID